MTTNDDRWLLPSRQSDLPGRDLVAPTLLHARREGTFLALAAVFLIATLALPLWFASAWVVDLTALPIDLADASELTIGVLVFPLALLAGQLVCALYGTRRAGMLVLAGTVASLAVVIGEQLAVASYPLALALPLVACATVANAMNVFVFAGATRALDGRALWLRSLLATPVALLIGWAAFAGTWAALGLDLDAALALAAAPCLYACACAIAGVLPLAIARRALGAYLRIGGRAAPPVDHTLLAVPPRRRLPPALIVDDEVLPVSPIGIAPAAPEGPTRAIRPQYLPFTTGEMQFFAEGEELSEQRDSFV